MKKAINLYVSNIDTMSKIDFIKDAGFDSIYTGIYNKPENIELDEIINIFKSYGFDIPQMHCSYIEPKLKYIWEDGEVGQQQIDNLLLQIDQTAKYGIKNFVIHTNGEHNPPISKIGLERIRTLLERCKKYDINLCVENLYDYKQLKYIFDNIEDDNLKICFDCGHHNCLTPNAPLTEELGHKIAVLHLHDNHGPIENGTGDEHLMVGQGEINLEKLASDIALMNDDIVLCAEYKVAPEKCNKEYFYKAKESLDKLEKLVLKYKNNYKEL